MFYFKNLVKRIIGIVFKVYSLLFKVLDNKTFIFMYHRVLDEGEKKVLSDSAMFVKSSSLKLHIREFSKNFDIISIDNYNNIYSDKKPQCVITFDDGWEDNYKFVLNCLAPKNIPATIFVTLNYIDTDKNFWFHKIWYIAQKSLDCNAEDKFFSCFSHYSGPNLINEQNITNLIANYKIMHPIELNYVIEKTFEDLIVGEVMPPSMLSWNQILDISKTSVSIGSHGMNHYILTNIDNTLKEKEINNSQNILHGKLDKVSRYFCYPNGNYDNDTINIVKNAGYIGGIGTKLGYNTSETKKYCLNRIALHDDVSSSVGLLWFRIFQAYLAGSTE